MPSEKKHRHRQAYAGLDFIKAAICPLDFQTVFLHNHPGWNFIKADDSLRNLEVGEALKYPRNFHFLDRQKNRKTGSQIVTAPIGLSPEDFDLFLGLYTYLQRLAELPDDGVTHFTLTTFSADSLNLGRYFHCPKDLRSGGPTQIEAADTVLRFVQPLLVRGSTN